MDLPVIGRFFRVTQNQTIQRDLIILVTPHIAAGPQLIGSIGSYP